MVKSEKERNSKSFQKWFPLKIVDSYLIPSIDVIEDFDLENLQFLIKLSVSMQILCIASQGIGLSAVQCGVPYKVFIASDDGIHFRTFANCTYTGISEKMDSLEGCLSLKDINGNLRRFILPRFPKVLVQGYEIFTNNPINPIKQIEEEFSGIFGVVLQHEIDHHEDKLICDLGKEVEVYK